MDHYSNTQHISDLQEEQIPFTSGPNTQHLITQLHDFWVPCLEDLPISQSHSDPGIVEDQLSCQNSTADGAYTPPFASPFGLGDTGESNSLTSPYDYDLGQSSEGLQDSLRPYTDSRDNIDPEPSQWPSFKPTRAPRRAHFSPLLIQFESTNQWDQPAQVPADDDLITNATSEAYLTLYQRGSLDVRVNDKRTWELQCP